MEAVPDSMQPPNPPLSPSPPNISPPSFAQRAGFPPEPKGRRELARLNAFPGAEIPAADVERWLAGLGFGLESAGTPEDTAWDVTVPSWRLFDFQPRPDGRAYEADFFKSYAEESGWRLGGDQPAR